MQKGRKKGEERAMDQTCEYCVYGIKHSVRVYGSICGGVVEYTYLLGLSEHLDLQVLPYAGRLDDALRILHLQFRMTHNFRHI